MKNPSFYGKVMSKPIFLSTWPIDFFILVSVSFALHFIWEVAQCLPFYFHGELPPTIRAMLVATFGDVLLTAVAYLAVGTFSKNISWIYQPWTFLQWFVMAITAFILSISVEKIGLQLNRWSYRPITPILPLAEVSIFPVLQLILLFPASFGISAKIGHWWHKRLKKIAPGRNAAI